MDALLPERLQYLVTQVTDSELAARLSAIFVASASAIGRLGELDLSRHETSITSDSADLSLWEELAPHVGSTIAAVNALLAEMHRQISGDGFGGDERSGPVTAVVSAAASELREAVAAFGATIRDPSVMGDQWALLTELQQFRARFRDRIGLCVFETAILFDECRRSDVDPGYQEALSQVLQIRATTADFRRLMRTRIGRVSESEAGDFSNNAQQIELELDAFRKTSAWRGMQAQDKRTILEHQARLAALRTPAVSKFQLLEVLEPLVEFVDSFADINNREILVQHDRERQAAIGVALERALNAQSDDEALEAFLEAVTEAQQLYGRSQEIDAFLRKQRRANPTVEGFRADLDEFLALIANLNLY